MTEDYLGKKRTEEKQRQLSHGERIERLRAKGKGWRDIFDKVIYSRGPGDNMYVYG